MDALHEVREFVHVQTSLLDLLGADRGGVPLSHHVATLAPTGTIRLGGEYWDYHRHGGGVLFKERGSGRVVDVHKLLDRPHVFDAWRLRTYFGSLGRRGVKLVAKAVGEKGLSLDEGVDKLLALLVESGDAVEDSGSYRFAERP